MSFALITNPTPPVLSSAPLLQSLGNRVIDMPRLLNQYGKNLFILPSMSDTLFVLSTNNIPIVGRGSIKQIEWPSCVRTAPQPLYDYYSYNLLHVLELGPFLMSTQIHLGMSYDTFAFNNLLFEAVRLQEQIEGSCILNGRWSKTIFFILFTKEQRYIADFRTLYE